MKDYEFTNLYYSSDTLNIFTDASIKKYDLETIGCPGAIAVVEGNVIDEKIDILRHTTNNNSEITAIYYGILLAIKYKDKYKNINLFSDSKICIFGLREWIFNWINSIDDISNNIEDYTEKYNPYILIGSSNCPVKNQSEINLIIQTILRNNLNIRLFHQRGHVSLKSHDSLNEARSVFCKNNNIDFIELPIIINLSTYNNMIDNITREMLIKYEYSYIGEKVPAIYFTYNTNMDMEKYSKLLNLSNLK